MTPRAAGFLSSGLTFVVAELVCRLLLHLAGGTVPLVVFPVTGLVAALTVTVLRRRSDEARAPRR